MNPQDQLTELLQEHSFDLVRQRKHKIYRNPDGLLFVTASTPSDRQAPQNALSTLKRILRQVNSTLEPLQVAEPAPLSEPVPKIHTPLPTEPIPSIEPPPAIEPAPAYMSDEEWEAWKRRYWHDVKLQAKNERFLSVISMYVGRVSEFYQKHKDDSPGHATTAACLPVGHSTLSRPPTSRNAENVGGPPAPSTGAVNQWNIAQAVKTQLRRLHYKSKVLLYHCKVFNQGTDVTEQVLKGIGEELLDVPILWAIHPRINKGTY